MHFFTLTITALTASSTLSCIFAQPVNFHADVNINRRAVTIVASLSDRDVLDLDTDLRARRLHADSVPLVHRATLSQAEPMSPAKVMAKQRFLQVKHWIEDIQAYVQADRLARSQLFISKAWRTLLHTPEYHPANQRYDKSTWRQVCRQINKLRVPSDILRVTYMVF